MTPKEAIKKFKENMMRIKNLEKDNENKIEEEEENAYIKGWNDCLFELIGLGYLSPDEARNLRKE